MITRYRGYDLQDFTSISGQVVIWWGNELICQVPTIDQAKKDIDEWLFAP